MKMLSIAFLTMWLLPIHLFSSSPVNATENVAPDGLELAELIINLAPSIVSDLLPPARGSERLVTNVTVTQLSHSVRYVIEGQDVYHNGRVLSTYWLTLTRNFQSAVGDADESAVGVGPVLRSGNSLSLEAQELTGFLLNALYDVEDMRLDHRRIKLDNVARTSTDPTTFELVGVNEVCEHTDLNTFLITIRRVLDERDRPFYETQLLHPYTRVPPQPIDSPLPR